MSPESFHDQSNQYPHVVAQFSSFLEMYNCDSGNIYDKSCDAIYFDEVADVVLKGTTVTVHTPNISGIAVQSATVYFSSSNTCAFGILFYHVESVQVNLVGTHSFEHGFAMQNARNISITNISIYKNQSTWNICIKYEQCPNCQRNHGI